MNYGEVKDEFTGLLNRRDATASQITMWLREGLERIQRELRVPAMEKIIEITVDGTYSDLTIPSDYLGLKHIRVVSTTNPYTLDRKGIKEVLTARVFTSSEPKIFTREGGKFLIGPYPTSGTVLRLVYYGDLTGLSATTDTNIITIIAPTLLIYSGLSYAADFFPNDKRAQRWEERYTQIKNELEGQDDDDELTEASVSQVTPWPNDGTD